jgi:hypothetical protein
MVPTRQQFLVELRQYGECLTRLLIGQRASFDGIEGVVSCRQRAIQRGDPVPANSGGGQDRHATLLIRRFTRKRFVEATPDRRQLAGTTIALHGSPAR